MRSTLRFAGVVLVLVASLIPAGAAAAAGGDSSGSPNAVVRSDVITEVTPLGWRVVAVAIRYRERIDLGRAEIPTSAFTVAATINNVTANRTVVAVYTNDDPEVDRRGTRGEPGRYLIIELNPNDPNAGALVFSGGINNPIPLVGAYSVTQNADVVDDRGRVRLPDTPFAITNQGADQPDRRRLPEPVVHRQRGHDPQLPPVPAAGTAGRRRGGFPLVVFLHGGGERGANNITQITANQGAVAFAKPERQARNPSYVLAPQVPVGSSWTTPAIQAALLELIDRVVDELSDRRGPPLPHGSLARRHRQLRPPPAAPGPVRGSPARSRRPATRAGCRSWSTCRCGRRTRSTTPPSTTPPGRCAHQRARGGGRRGHARAVGRQPARGRGRGAGAEVVARRPRPATATRCSRPTRRGPRRSAPTGRGCRPTSTTS